MCHYPANKKFRVNAKKLRGAFTPATAIFASCLCLCSQIPVCSAQPTLELAEKIVFETLPEPEVNSLAKICSSRVPGQTRVFKGCAGFDCDTVSIEGVAPLLNSGRRILSCSKARPLTEAEVAKAKDPQRGSFHAPETEKIEKSYYFEDEKGQYQLIGDRDAALQKVGPITSIDKAKQFIHIFSGYLFRSKVSKITAVENGFEITKAYHGSVNCGFDSSDAFLSKDAEIIVRPGSTKSAVRGRVSDC